MPACALCGTATPPPYRAPPPEGSPDLDGRPGEPTRSTLRRWVQICPGCGACAPDLAALPAAAKDLVEGAAYAALASPFERWAFLARRTGGEAAHALLQAAWAGEDDGRAGTARRRRALLAGPAPADAEGMVRLADMQRRAGLLQRAAATLDAVVSNDDGVIRIVAFERTRIAMNDTGRHLLSSALRPPARTPHVSHGKAQAGGFWSRLFGRSTK